MNDGWRRLFRDERPLPGMACWVATPDRVVNPMPREWYGFDQRFCNAVPGEFPYWQPVIVPHPPFPEPEKPGELIQLDMEAK